jgi:hypothetical protein
MEYKIEYVTVAGRRIVRAEYEAFLRDLVAALKLRG